MNPEKQGKTVKYSICGYDEEGGYHQKRSYEEFDML